MRKYLFLVDFPTCEMPRNPHRPAFTFTVPAVLFGESIASEGIGEYMFVEGRVLTTGRKSISGAVIETWEADGEGEPCPCISA